MTLMQWYLFCSIVALTMFVFGCSSPLQTSATASSHNTYGIRNQLSTPSMVADVGSEHKLYKFTQEQSVQNMNINQLGRVYATSGRPRPTLHLDPNAPPNSNFPCTQRIETDMQGNILRIIKSGNCS